MGCAPMPPGIAIGVILVCAAIGLVIVGIIAILI